MNITAILTTACNLRCSYCFEQGCAVRSMDEATALRACEFAYGGEAEKNGISFFGGEPLLRRELLEKMVAYCGQLGTFSFNITTNGLLLDESFIEFARLHKIRIALSHDGLAQDICRRFADGRGSAAMLEKPLRLVTSLPNSVIMLTTTPQTVGLFADSVAWLWEQGARAVIAVPDGRPDIWDDSSMEQLKEQHGKLAAEYKKRLLRGDKVSLPVFDLKITDRVRGETRCNSCRIGYKQPIVDTDGGLYPCNQFNSLPEYRIGDVFGGFDEEKRRELLLRSVQPVESCAGCGIADRCAHSCPCTNFQQTGSFNTVSPFICTYQRILVETADRFAEELYRENSAVFMRKFSKPEDMTGVVI